MTEISTGAGWNQSKVHGVDGGWYFAVYSTSLVQRWLWWISLIAATGWFGHKHWLVMIDTSGACIRTTTVLQVYLKFTCGFHRAAAADAGGHHWQP